MPMKTGDIVRVKSSAPNGAGLPPGSIGIMVRKFERIWDFGSGDYGFYDSAEVMTSGRIFEVACDHLETLNG